MKKVLIFFALLIIPLSFLYAGLSGRSGSPIIRIIEVEKEVPVPTPVYYNVPVIKNIFKVFELEVTIDTATKSLNVSWGETWVINKASTGSNTASISIKVK